MPRYQLIIEYHGAGFVGWQHQENGLSVQQALEQAIFEFCQQRLRITAAGRTDSGVHARGQSIHFDLTEATGPEVIRDALNYHLRDHGVSVLDACLAADDFDARRSAKARHYLYRIINRRAAPTIDKGLAWHVPRRLDAEAMHAAAQRLVGHHDFTTFRAIRCQARSPVKTLDRLDVERQGDKITIRAEARSFLHHQVRSMVGTLKLVGEGKWTGDDVAHALAARDRTALGLNAPAHGLYLMRVIY